MYNLPEKSAPGGRVYAMTATGEIEKRIWIGTSVSFRALSLTHANTHAHTHAGL